MKIAIFLFLLLVPMATAIDCTLTAHPEMCEEIMQSDLTDEEKNYLVADIMSDTKHYPDHSLVRDWNLQSTVIPDNMQNQGVIRNAWIKIGAIMPSVLYDEKLHIDTGGEIITGEGYDVVLPRGTTSGDCRTDRRVYRNNTEKSLSINNQEVQSRFRHDTPHMTPIEIQASYDILVTTEIQHYTMQVRCQYCSPECLWNRTEYKNDRLVVEDSVVAVIHNPFLEASFEVEDTYNGTINGNLVSEDFVNLELDVGESYLHKHNYVFSEILENGMLQVYAEYLPSHETKGVKGFEDKLLIPENDECNLRLYDFFERKVVPCFLEKIDLSFTVDTDSQMYMEGDTIIVTIEPSERLYSVEYAGVEYETDGRLELTAIYPYNRVSVSLEDRTSHALFHVAHAKSMKMFLLVGMFILFNYIIISLLQKWRIGAYA
ncbi:TPA: hypothetical protein HA278_00140 [Candidatus Woesearchaeota archaeon]|nr:hypothetical protein [Candidatus Woesearchaeota archaeon]